VFASEALDTDDPIPTILPETSTRRIVAAMTDHEFWHQRWLRGEIGFHLDTVHPALAEYWTSVNAQALDPVLVPLAGKSLDMKWLAERGHEVVGVELDPNAAQMFFEEAGWTPHIDDAQPLKRWHAANVTLFQGDFFDFRADTPFQRFYDRAALIALPPAERPRYLQHLAAQLAPGARGLLVTLEYPQDQMKGPPFSVKEAELASQHHFDFRSLSRKDVLKSHPRFAQRGVDRLHEVVYLLERRAVR